MGSPTALLVLTLGYLNYQSGGHSDFEVFSLVKVAELGHMLLLNNTKRRPCGDSKICQI